MYEYFNTNTAPYTASCLFPSDENFSKFLLLQSFAIASAPSDKRHHLKERGIEDLKAHIDARMPIIAVHTADGQYVAHALLAYPIHDDVVQNLQHYPFNGMEATTAVIQSLYVAPKHRASQLDPMLGQKGMDPTSLIFDTAKELAITHGHTQIMAKVAADNTGSLKTFEKNGFFIQETAWDETGGYLAHFLNCSLYAAPCLAAAPQSTILLEKGPRAA